MRPPLDDALVHWLPSFLPAQRWFGGKARSVSGCRVEDLVELGAGTGGATLAVAEVAYVDGPRDRYALLVSSRETSDGLPVLGRLDEGGDWLVESATDPSAVRLLLRGFARGSDVAMQRGGRLRYADARDGARDGARDAARQDALPVATIGAEQSNTSLRVGSAGVFKLFRRLEEGENPELEVGRFLTSRTSFRALAALDGSLTYVPEAGEPATLGVLQSWVENEGDGWRYVLGRLRGALATGTPAGDLESAMTMLGGITADCHAALASDRESPAFAPEPVTEADQRDWCAQVSERAARVRTLVERRLESWPAETRDLGVSLLAEPAVASMFSAIPTVAGLSRIRIHGDYHLGQTLRTPASFVIIDFEGEPARSIRERRQKQCALRDVAGMLRSFEYAFHTASEGRADDAAWLRDGHRLREGFLGGYWAGAARHDAAWVPADEGARHRWLRVFELDKVLYELEYEVNNRPAWVHIPLRGILRMLDQSPL